MLAATKPKRTAPAKEPNATYAMNDTQESKTLDQQFEALTHQLSRYTSYKAVFLRGIVYGVGTALGATVIAAMVFGLFRFFAQPLFEATPLESDTFLPQN